MSATNEGWTVVASGRGGKPRGRVGRGRGSRGGNNSRNKAQNAAQGRKPKSESDHLKQTAAWKHISYRKVVAAMSAKPVVISDLHQALSNLVGASSQIKLVHSIGWGQVASHLANMGEEERAKMEEDRRETIKGIKDMLLFKQEAETPKENLEFDKSKLRVICWDLGNRILDYLAQRMEAFADFILRENFDILLLQQVNPMVAKYLKARLDHMYTFIAGKNIGNRELVDVNYTLISQRLRFVSSKIIYFLTDKKQSLLSVKVKIGYNELFILNTHLESKEENSDRRIKQLWKCFDMMQRLNENVIFGGTLNVRDPEWQSQMIGVEGEKLLEWDLWNKLGDDDNKFTWDLRNNKLFQFGEGPQPHCRFDQMYFCPGKSALLKPSSFDLTGREIVAGGKYCVSDHYGIVTEFNICKNTWNALDFYEVPAGYSSEDEDSKPVEMNQKKERPIDVEDLELPMKFVRLNKSSHLREKRIKPRISKKLRMEDVI